MAGNAGLVYLCHTLHAKCSSLTPCTGRLSNLIYIGYKDRRYHSCRYDIEQLAQEGDFLDSAYLLLHGELPTAGEKAVFEREVTLHTLVHEQLIQFYKGFKHDAHPMAIMVIFSYFFLCTEPAPRPFHARLCDVAAVNAHAVPSF